MPPANPTQNRQHLSAALLAVMLVLALVLVVPQIMSTLGHQGLDRLLVEQNTQKNLGRLLQRMAFGDAHMLPLYGSSELTKLVPNRADQFFANAPTGFKVCPVGSAGNTCLMMAEKIAAQGGRIRGRKLVILLSTSWFRRPQIPPDHYKGNFSTIQAMQIMLSGQINREIRHRFAERMLDYPDTLKDQPALMACVRQRARTDPLSFSLGVSLRPLLYLQHTSLLIEDQLGTLLSLATKPPADAAPVELAKADPFSWDAILSQADKFTEPTPATDYDVTDKEGSRDKGFIDGFNVEHNKEWTDFDLMLDTLKDLDARPLIIAIPLDGQYEAAHGTSLKGRNFYYDRLAKSCADRGFPMAHFPEHDQDKLFVLEHSSHLSGRGWLFMDKLLDDFYHDRLPETVATANHP